MSRELGPDVHISRDGERHRVSFISSAPQKPISRPAGLRPSAAPRRVAQSFLGRYGNAFGVAHPGRDLRLTSVRAAPRGRSAVRFQQLHKGVPVIGGELVVNVDSRGRILSAGGEALPRASLGVQPRITGPQAKRAARAVVSREYGVPATQLRTSRARLAIYDSRLLGGPGLRLPTLVWRMEVTADSLESIRELALVDAKLGNIALHFSEVAEARNRRVCDAHNLNWVPCTSPVRAEGDPPSSVADVNLAYQFSGDVYDFYSSRFGRDSLDGQGTPLVSTVRACDPSYGCPMANAFWNGKQVVFGAGFVVDDVVGHEFTHGVTHFTSNLFDYYQSGAIDESLSDVFGEFIDLTNGAGTDTATTRWQWGEDRSSGPSRDMQNPPLYGDPDRMTSPLYQPDLDERDSGGVHFNNGVNNKAAYLMTDGGTFNGRTITGLGISKVAQIYYEVDTNLLTSGSDYADLYDALQQACTNLVGTAGITAANCVQVKNAALAVEMNQDPPNASAPEARVCPGGDPPTNLFFDNLENTASGNWTKLPNSADNGWYYPPNSNPFHFNRIYATSGKQNLWGDDPGVVADYSIAMAHPVALPTRTYLRFNHAHGFDNDVFYDYDGGVVEYKADGGPWTDARALFADNGYNGTISTGTNNPLEARKAFVAESDGYISSRLNLSTLAGKSVRFRFRIGTDVSVDDYGWFIDDVRIYRCPAATEPTDTTKPTARAPTESLSQDSRLGIDPSGDSIPVRLSWPAGSDNLTDVGNLQYRLASTTNGGPWTNETGWRDNRNVGLLLRPNDEVRYRVTARDEAGNVSQPAPGPSFLVFALQEDNSTFLNYSAGWGVRVAQDGAFGGYVKPTSTANATVTLNFSGSHSVGVVMPRRGGLGTAQMCVIGGISPDCGTRDLSHPVGSRFVVYEPITELNPANTYTLRVKNLSGRIELDAILALLE